eukprot:17773-Rhodomonas_salina.2
MQQPSRALATFVLEMEGSPLPQQCLHRVESGIVIDNSVPPGERVARTSSSTSGTKPLSGATCCTTAALTDRHTDGEFCGFFIVIAAHGFQPNASTLNAPEFLPL